MDQTMLAERLVRARAASGLSQEDVARDKGISRSAIAKIEAGKRTVSSIELGRLSRCYGRDMRDFLGDEFNPEASLVAIFRAAGRPLEDASTRAALRNYAALARQMTSLETMLRVGGGSSLPNLRYRTNPPTTKPAAISGGQAFADQERRRLDLGVAPIGDMGELLAAEGYRVAFVQLPDEVSGLTLVTAETGPLIVINKSHHRTRRRFSMAHEYCHALLDCEHRPAISVQGAANFEETRANSFAANLLMPVDGVRRFLDSLGGSGFVGKGTRPGTAEPAGRSKSGIRLNEIVLLAHHFDVSRIAALHRLRSLKLIGADDLDALRRENEVRGQRLAGLLGLTPAGRDEDDSFHPRLLSLSMDAYHFGEISRSKLVEIHEAARGRDLTPEEASGLFEDEAA